MEWVVSHGPILQKKLAGAAVTWRQEEAIVERLRKCLKRAFLREEVKHTFGKDAVLQNTLRVRFTVNQTLPAETARDQNFHRKIMSCHRVDEIFRLRQPGWILCVILLRTRIM